MDLDSIAAGRYDIYGFLGLTSTASAAQVRSLYRKKALEVHPDKDPSPEAASQFAALSRIYEILSNDELRREYDSVRAASLQKQRDTAEASATIRRFREKLAAAEKQHHQPASSSPQSIEKLREESLKKRQQLELRVRSQGSGYVSSRDLNGPRIAIWGGDEAVCTVRWKRKKELDGHLSEDVVAEIMSIFGEVVSVLAIPRNEDERYDLARVVFESHTAMEAATSHDYRKSATKWDGTRVRKLASLLRGCEREEGGPGRKGEEK